MKKFILAVFGGVALAAHPFAAQAWQPKEPQILQTMRNEANGGLVGVVYGGMDATDLGKATDLAISFETQEGQLRPFLMVGKGAVRNVTDIVLTRGVDMGIVQSDVLTSVKRDPPFPGIDNDIQYITKLYDEEVHILTTKDVTSIQELASKKVNFGIPDSGTHTTAEAIFKTLFIDVEPTSFPQSVALDKLRRGEIAALVCLVSKPDRWFKSVRSEENLHFLPIPPTTELREQYTLSTLTADDYPELIDTDAPVSTVAVGNVLAVYNFAPNTIRYKKVARFVSAFFDRLHELGSPPYHPKWREVDVTAPIPGWRRFAAAQEWLRNAGLDTGGSIRNAASDEGVARREVRN
jgi:uncharacterized protein